MRVRTYTQAGGAHEGATQVFIFAHDQANLFAATAAILDQQDLSVHEARVHTTGRAECFNSFMVLTDAGTPLTNEDAQRHLEATLRAVLAEPNAFPDVVRRRMQTSGATVLYTSTWDALATIAGESWVILRLDCFERPRVPSQIRFSY